MLRAIRSSVHLAMGCHRNVLQTLVPLSTSSKVQDEQEQEGYAKDAKPAPGTHSTESEEKNNEARILNQH